MKFDWEGITVNESKKLLRAVLKSNFPTTKFSITTAHMSWSDSLSVHYTDGPAGTKVWNIVRNYGGLRFDGSIDLQYNAYHWLRPNGVSTYAGTHGTRGSGGMYPEEFIPMPESNCKCVLFCNWASYDRDCTHHSYDLAAREFEKIFCIPFDTDAKLNGEWHTDLRSRLLDNMDIV